MLQASIEIRYYFLGKIFITIGKYNDAKINIINSLKIANNINNKHRMINLYRELGCLHFHLRDYYEAIKNLVKSISIQKEFGDEKERLSAIIYLYNTYKILGRKYDKKEIIKIINRQNYINFSDNFLIFQLLEEKSYLETSYNQIQEKASAMEKKLKAKFLSYPIPKAIVEEWEKVK